jgi:hypothetical protein
LSSEPHDKKAQPIVMAAKVTKRTIAQAVASVLGKPSSTNTIVIDGPAEHPFKKQLMADINAATAKAALANTRAKPPPGVASIKAKSPPEEAKKNEKPMTIRLPRTSKISDGKTVATTVGLPKSRHAKSKKTKPGWEKDYSDDESADKDDEGFSVITHDHADTKN